MVVPCGTLPNDTVLGVAVSSGATPVPLKMYFATLFVALLVILSEPDAAPAMVGANRTATVMLAPTAKLFGAVSPVTLNSAPVTDSAEIDTLAVPVFLIVTVILWLDSNPTLPRLPAAGVKVSVPVVGVVVASGCAPAVAPPSMPSRSVAAATAARVTYSALFL